MSWYRCQCPRSRVRGSLVPSRAWAGDAAQGDDHPGPDGPDLLVQKGQAGGNLIGLGVTVSRRPALEDVGDIDLFPAQAQLAEQIVQEPARRRPRRARLVDLRRPPAPPPRTSTGRPRPRPQKPGSSGRHRACTGGNPPSRPESPPGWGSYHPPSPGP